MTLGVVLTPHMCTVACVLPDSHKARCGVCVGHPGAVEVEGGGHTGRPALSVWQVPEWRENPS